MPLSSLYGKYAGGKVSTRVHEPSDSEGLALTAGAMLLWTRLRDSSHRDFWSLVAEEVKRAEHVLASDEAAATTRRRQREARKVQLEARHASLPTDRPRG